jgi:hypothetical protein
LRFVACARAACGQVFFLCRRCDHGHRYCGSRCAGLARRASVRAAGDRYQASRDGAAVLTPTASTDIASADGK